MLKNLIQDIIKTSPEKLACGECHQVLDKFAEAKLAGKVPAIAMPMVQDHLNQCDQCSEEFQALLDALKAIEEDK